MTNKERFKYFVNIHIKRKGIDKVMDMLEKSDFYTAPASTRYHEAYEGGLVEHSLRVFDELINEYRGTGVELESIAIVSLFHDICKTNYYVVDYRNTKDENGKWIKVPYYTVDDKLPLGHGEKSVIMLMELMELTYDEICAIRWHMGAYSGQQDWNTLSKAYSDCPMALHLHVADMKATYLKKV